jgi:pilus assembly protein CpaD
MPQRSNGSCLLLLALLGLLGACNVAPLPTNYEERFPIETQAETIAFPVVFARGRDPFAGEAGQRLDQAVIGYLERGHGTIQLNVATPGRPDPVRQTSELFQVRDRLVQRGVPASAIRTGVTDTALPVDTVTVSYERYTATLPKCGDWSAPSSYNPNNTEHSDFGCAWQRNLGVLAADPADLVHARGSDTFDAQRSDDVVTKYRTGLPTATQPTAHVSPQQQNSSISSVGGQ